MSLLSSFTDDKPNDFFLSFFPSHCSPRFQMSLFAYPYPGIETNFIISSSSIVSSYVWQRKNREIEPLFRKEEETKIKKKFRNSEKPRIQRGYLHPSSIFAGDIFDASSLDANQHQQVALRRETKRRHERDPAAFTESSILCGCIGLQFIERERTKNKLG